MKNKTNALTRFNRILVCIYEWHLTQKMGIVITACEQIEVIENYLLFLQSKNLKIKSSCRNEIENYTSKDKDKESLHAFYSYIEKFF